MSYFAVFGNPVSHSLSPLIHQRFAHQEGIDLRYEKIEVPVGKLQETLDAFRRQGGKGANITLPFKHEAFMLCEKRLTGAWQSKTVNTIGWDNETLWGDNTDGEGFLQDLTRNKGVSLKDKRLLILGGGGAAQGILPVLLKQPVESITLLNRDMARVKTLEAYDERIQIFHYDELPSHVAPFDVVINATSASLYKLLPPLEPRWLAHTFAIDLAYQQDDETIFVKWAREHGAKQVADGIGMLVEQAALGFQKWHQVMPDTKPVIESLSSLPRKIMDNEPRQSQGSF